MQAPFTLEELWQAILIVVGGLLGIAAAIVTIGKAIDIVKSWRKPHCNVAAQLADHEERLCDNNERFDEQERMISSLQEGQRVTCVGMQALLESAVYGNNATGVSDAYGVLKSYLTGGVGKK